MLMPAEVAAVESYWQNPYFKHGMHAEETLLLALEIRQELSRLDSRTQFILQAQAAGFTSREMASLLGVSPRTMARRVAELTGQRRAA